MYVLANNTRVVPYFYQAAIHDSKYGTTRVLFASTHTAKQLKTMYYFLSIKTPLACLGILNGEPTQYLENKGRIVFKARLACTA